ncbi:MAG: ABC transporter permease, partial [Opitutales bacterium]
MNFILKMAWRDTRASRRRLLLHALSIVLGVAALVGISSLGDNLRQAVDTQAKGLLGADLAVFGRQEFSPRLLARLQATGGELARGINLNTMAGFGESSSRLVQLAGTDGGYPFFGEVETAPAAAFDRLSDGHSALVEEAALTQSGLAVGGPLRLGSTVFTVAGALKKYPGLSPMASLFAPRVQVSLAALRATGLLQRGSLVQYAVYLRLPAATDAAVLAKALRDEFKGERVTFTTAEDRRAQIGEALENVFSFISLVGFLALFLGAVGIASALHVYIREKLATVAVLRCLGASARTSFAIYLTQGVGLGAAGTALGIGLGLALQAVLPMVLHSYLPAGAAFAVSWPALLKGVVAGVGVSALFTLLPLLEVRRVSPLRVLRSGFGEEAPASDPWRWAVYAAIACCVLGVATWQTGHWRYGLAFSAAMGIGFAVLAGAAHLAIRLARRARLSRLPFAWRQGVANIHRPQNRTHLLVMSLGLGTFLLLTLALTRASLLARLEGMGAGARPNLVFFDVQPDQIDRLAAIARRENVPLLKTSPIITMRLTSLQG